MRCALKCPTRLRIQSRGFEVSRDGKVWKPLKARAEGEMAEADCLLINLGLPVRFKLRLSK